MKVCLGKREIAPIRAEDQDPNNIFVIVAARYPWDLIAAMYRTNGSLGRPPLSAREAFATMIIRVTEHMSSFKDTVAGISDSISKQFLCGYETYSTAPRFAASSISNFYKRFTPEDLQAINELMTMGRIPSQWYRINEAGERVCKDDECEYYIALAKAYLQEHPEIAKLSEAYQDTPNADATGSSSGDDQLVIFDAAQVANMTGSDVKGAISEEVAVQLSLFDDHMWYHDNLLNSSETANIEDKKNPVNPDIAVEEDKKDSEDTAHYEESNSDSVTEEKKTDSAVMDLQEGPISLGATVKDSADEDRNNPDSTDSSDGTSSSDTTIYDHNTPTACDVMDSSITEQADRICSTPGPPNDGSSTRAPPHLEHTLYPASRMPTDDNQHISTRSPPLMEAHQITDTSQSLPLSRTILLVDPSLNLTDFVQKLAENRVNRPLFAPKSVAEPPKAFYLKTPDLPSLCLSAFANDVTVLPFISLMRKQSSELLSMQVHDFLMEVFILISEKYFDERHYEFERRKILWGIIKISESLAKYLSLYNRVKKYDYAIEMLNYISWYFRHGPDIILDATVFPANIKYPTDFELVHDARVILENLSYKLLITIYADPDTVKNEYKIAAGYDPGVAHSEFLAIVKQKKCPTEDKKAALDKGLKYLNKAINYYNKLRSQLPDVKLYRRSERKVPVIQTVYDQQLAMLLSGENKCDNRVVSFDQNFVHPIFRGKIPISTEFGLKVNLMVINGFVHDLHHSWNAFNEGTELYLGIEHIVQSTDLLPTGVLADEIYKNTANCILCKCLGIRFTGKRLKKKNPEILSDDDKAQTKKDYILRILVEAIIGTLKTRYELRRLASITADNQIKDVQLAILAKNVRKQIIMGI